MSPCPRPPPLPQQSSTPLLPGRSNTRLLTPDPASVSTLGAGRWAGLRPLCSCEERRGGGGEAEGEATAEAQGRL